MDSRVRARLSGSQVFVVLLAVLLSALSSPAMARTLGAIMIAECPNGARISALARQLKEAVAMADATRFALSKGVAREYFRCSLSLNGYSHDIAVLLYAEAVLNSTKTNGDVLNAIPEIRRRFNDLAGVTKYTDIKKYALEDRQKADDQLKSAREAAYGTPSPSPTE